MHLGINFFWILGYSSTYLLFHSYELAQAHMSSYECKKVSGRFPDGHVGAPTTISSLLSFIIIPYTYTAFTTSPVFAAFGLVQHFLFI